MSRVQLVGPVSEIIHHATELTWLGWQASWLLLPRLLSPVSFARLHHVYMIMHVTFRLRFVRIKITESANLNLAKLG